MCTKLIENRCSNNICREMSLAALFTIAKSGNNTNVHQQINQCAQLLILVRLFATLWTIAHQVPLSVRILQARILKWVVMPSFRGSSQPGIKPWSPTLQADSLPSELPRKPKNTGMGSLSLLQQIFPTQAWTGVSCIASGFFTS